MRLQLTFARDPGHVVHHPVDVEELRLLQQLDVVRGEGRGELGGEHLPPGAVVVQDDQRVGGQGLEV